VKWSEFCFLEMGQVWKFEEMLLLEGTFTKNFVVAESLRDTK